LQSRIDPGLRSRSTYRDPRSATGDAPGARATQRDGTSTPLGDLREAQAIWSTFGEHTPNIAISATKSMTGHLMGAAGAVEGVFTVLSVYNQCAPATLNFRDEDPEINLNVVSGGARSMEIRYAMSDNIGLGGHNGAVIFKRYDGD